MATAAVTYTFANGTNADGTQVNSNFTSVVNFLNTEVVQRDASVAFTAIPSLPATDPTTANQAVRKSYVDNYTPAGVITQYGGSSAPTGWLLCQGQAISRTNSLYTRLFTAISTTYGAGDGTTGSAPGEYFEKAHIDVTFNSQSQQVGGMDVGGSDTIPALQFDQTSPVEMSSFTIQYSPQMIRIPGGALKWATATATGAAQTVPSTVKDPSLSGGEYIRKPSFNLNITLHNCLYIDAGNFADKVGRVNESTMWGNCEPESVLLDGVSSTQRSLSNGIVILDVTLNYKWQKIGWNVAMGSNGELYRYVKQNGLTVYNTGDINPASVILPSQRWRPTSF